MKVLVPFAIATVLFCAGGAAAAGEQGSNKLTVCPTSEFSVVFEPEELTLSQDDVEGLEALAARVRQCFLDRVTLLVLEENALGNARRSAVSQQLIALGIDPSRMQSTAYEGRTYYHEPAPDTVMVTVFFDHMLP